MFRVWLLTRRCHPTGPNSSILVAGNISFKHFLLQFVTKICLYSTACSQKNLGLPDDVTIDEGSRFLLSGQLYIVSWTSEPLCRQSLGTSDYWYRQCPKPKKKKKVVFSIFIQTYRLSFKQQSASGSVKTVNQLLFPLSSLFSWSLLCYSLFFFPCLAAHTARSSFFWITWLWRSWDGSVCDILKSSYHGYNS